MKEGQGVDYVDKFTQTISKNADVATKKLNELAASILKTDKAKKESVAANAPSKPDTSHKTDYADIARDADRSIASLKSQQQAIGLSAEAAARLKYEQQLLNQADQAGIALTAAQTAELKDKAAEMAHLEVTTAEMNSTLSQAKDSATGFLSTLRQGLESGQGWWKSFGSAAVSVLDKIASAIETKLVDMLFSQGNAGFNILSLFGLVNTAPGGVASGVGPQTASAASSVASSSSIRASAPRAAPAPRSVTAQGQGVHITVGLKKNGLNIEPEVVDIARIEARSAAGAVQGTFNRWRDNGFHKDVENHLKSRRVTGRSS